MYFSLRSGLFNNYKTNKMRSVLHTSDSRGTADLGWLYSRHTFSFSNYHNPKRMNFGLLRVLNDDTVSEGKGFGTHPHQDMEIVSIPLDGDLKHEDSMGNETVIKSGDIQIMSAGTGIQHSEYNYNPNKSVKFLQIWVFPNKNGVTPRYDQITLDVADRHNKLQQILSPNPDDEGVWIHQNAWFHMTKMDKGQKLSHRLHKPNNNGIYIFILNGNSTVNGQSLKERDGLGLWEIQSIDVEADTKTEILLIEVPMN